MLKYIRIGLHFGLYLLFRYPKILWYRIFKKKIPYEKRYDYVRFLTNKMMKRLHIECIIEGEENLPKTNNIVFLPNHQSLFDTVMLFSKLPHRVTFIAKKETAKMPIIGSIVRSVDVIFLDREDARSALKTLKFAAEELKNDKNLVVFLEGTRSKNENHEVGAFKNGGIRPAYMAQSTLVPIAFDRSWEIFDKKIKKKCYQVKMVYLPAIAYEQYKDMNYAELAMHLQNLVVDKLAKIRQEALV